MQCIPQLEKIEDQRFMKQLFSLFTVKTVSQNTSIVEQGWEEPQEIGIIAEGLC